MDTPNSPGAASERLAVLDGWRGISILLVLAAHLLPLGPRALQLNGTAGVAGMALFFTLSGFLITRFVLTHTSVVDFLTRRFFRIVPLAWTVMLVVLATTHAPLERYAANLLFYANLPPQQLPESIGHFWSLCVEMQFYVAIALVIALLGRRGLWLLPVACVLVSAHRAEQAAYADIVTWRRVDEILAGGVLAMAWAGRFGAPVRAFVARAPTLAVLAALLAACHPATGPFNVLRPYLAALLVGSTLAGGPLPLRRLLEGRVLAYVGMVSYALYVFHGVLVHTWLGTGDTLVKYAKRPLLFAFTFALAHVSTFGFEHRAIALGKRVAARLRGAAPPGDAAARGGGAYTRWRG